MAPPFSMVGLRQFADDFDVLSAIKGGLNLYFIAGLTRASDRPLERGLGSWLDGFGRRTGNADIGIKDVYAVGCGFGGHGKGCWVDIGLAAVVDLEHKGHRSVALGVVRGIHRRGESCEVVHAYLDPIAEVNCGANFTRSGHCGGGFDQVGLLFGGVGGIGGAATRGKQEEGSRSEADLGG